MLKRQYIPILLAAWLGIEIAVSWLAFCQPHDQHSEAYQRYQEYCALRGPFLSSLWWALEWLVAILHHRDKEIVAVFTVILAFSTILLWISTRDAARGGDRAANIAEQSLTKLQRAFVSFQGMRYFSHTAPDGTVWWSLHFNWLNSGTSPARSARFYVSKYFEDVDLPSDFDFKVLTNLSANFIGPQGSMQSHGPALTADELMAVRENKKFLYFWGRVDYRDIFDGTPDHVTKFAIRIRDFRGDPSKFWDEKANIVELIVDNSPSRHNCADEDCDNR